MAKNRLTGSDIVVQSADEAGMDEKEDGIFYYSICNTHSTLVGHRTKTLALFHSRVPEWCEECQKIMEKKINCSGQ